jgi:DNA-directed RNA polymerase specialized sigma24 family protein
MYLGRVICNTAIQAYHARRRHRVRNSPLDEHLPGFSACAPQLSMDRDERHGLQLLRLLEEGLARLPLKQYQALQLTVLDTGVVSIRDAGTQHSIPYSTLRDRKQQGLLRLKKFLLKSIKKWEKSKRINPGRNAIYS